MDNARKLDPLPRKKPSGIGPRTGRLVEVNNYNSARFGLPPAAGEFPVNWDWQPGRIEVEFDLPVHSALMIPGIHLHTDVLARLKFSLTALHDILRKYMLQEAYFTLREFGLDLPANLHALPLLEAVKSLWDRFITYRFPGDVDLWRIASELLSLSQVRRAVPIPKIAPPHSPLNEPLVKLVTVPEEIDSARHFQNQWYLVRCQATDAWNLDFHDGTPPHFHDRTPPPSGDRVVIADVDWGF